MKRILHATGSAEGLPSDVYFTRVAAIFRVRSVGFWRTGNHGLEGDPAGHPVGSNCF